jgi:hypothetical protein
MKKIVTCVLALGLSTLAVAEPKAKKGAAPSPDEMQKMMAAMEKAGAPGPEHKQLAETAGNWSTVSRFWMEPGKPPMETQGAEEVKPVLGGRFIESHYTGNMMGKPFEGMGLEGYDNLKKKYVMTWADSTGTMIIYAEGTGDAKQRTFTGDETLPNGQ